MRAATDRRTGWVMGPGLLLMLLAMAGSSPGQEPPGFTIVVHPSSSLTEVESSRLSDIFLKKVSTWDDGSEVLPIDQVAESEVRQRFSELVHGRDTAAVRSYWQRQIFTGLGVPPQEVASDQEVLELVRTRPDAIGYVSTAIAADGVKRLRLAD